MPWEARGPAEQEPAPGPDLLGGIEALLDIHIEACSISTNGALHAAPASDLCCAMHPTAISSSMWLPVILSGATRV